MRLEAWSFFEPHDADDDSAYSLFSNRATLGVRVKSRRFEIQGAFQYALVMGLPRRTTDPGPFGPGTLYRDAARTPSAYQLYFKALSVRLKGVAPGVSFEVGRMGFTSGAEARSASPALETIRRERLEGRLIDQVAWSTFERAFDGIRVDVDRARWHATTALLWPTQGVFEESANPTMGGVRVGTGSVTLRSRTNEAQFFAHHYSDHREIPGRPDNTALTATSANVSVTTVGASHVGLFPAARGRIDTLLWVAGQAGAWYGDAHRGFSGEAEAGYQWLSAWRPWIRAGLLYASGDDDPGDVRHRTFFPLLPATRPDPLGSTFAQMNHRDVFAQLRFEPQTRVVVSTDIYRMSLATSEDRWYSGTGATARRGTFFGYTSRPSLGSRSLGTLAQVSAEMSMTRRWRLKASLGLVKGGEVVRRLFADDRLTVFLLESAVGF